ncbi:hypothetical protein EYF80_002418 [Liparis tanakae]|uniref:Uncharacterized protein n=1 Tax=Liparis tanakae TaxID=230148 RepID=A0A4Z2JAM5_9TELE|nr:hypothetical protein EYF80_002418 [Liparis tanakae]
MFIQEDCRFIDCSAARRFSWTYEECDTHLQMCLRLLAWRVESSRRARTPHPSDGLIKHTEICSQAWKHEYSSERPGPLFGLVRQSLLLNFKVRKLLRKDQSRKPFGQFSQAWSTTAGARHLQTTQK